MMAAKARLMGDSTSLANIMATRKSDDAKKLGRQIKPWNEELWQKERFGTICKGTELNFLFKRRHRRRRLTVTSAIAFINRDVTRSTSSYWKGLFERRHRRRRRCAARNSAESK